MKKHISNLYYNVKLIYDTGQQCITIQNKQYYNTADFEFHLISIGIYYDYICKRKKLSKSKGAI